MPPVDHNIYDMTEAEKKKVGIESLPSTLYDAVQELRKDAIVREALGEHIFTRFCDAKELEWYNYNTAVHDWEVQAYLSRY